MNDDGKRAFRHEGAIGGDKKTERTARKVHRSREQARGDVFDYITKRLYNPTRRHSTLGYVSPIQFEKAQKA